MRSPGRMTRRAALGTGLATAAALLVAGEPARRSSGPLFGLGVASGEPAADGMVLWTRLAPGPLAEDGFGGMGQRRTEVAWQLAEDERFGRVVRAGTVATGPEVGHSVHVEPAGLPPGRDWFYRFRTADQISPVGRTRTAPEPSAAVPLTACVASCAHYEQGLFTAYRRLAEEEPDLVVFLGDYIYELGGSAGGNSAGGRVPTVRTHVGRELRTLADYRRRYAQYKTDPDLQAAHAAAPWLAVYDDHEVSNDWAGDVPDVPRPGFHARRIAASQAYWENLPLRADARPTDAGMALYRRVGWGALATFHMLDTRQHRDDQPCGDHVPGECPERADPARSMLGSAQERWLADGLAASRARWDLLGQQVPFAQVDVAPGAAHGYVVDGWDGYPAARERLVRDWVPARNPVVLSGDAHWHWAIDLHEQPGDPGSPMVGTELVATSIASDGDGAEQRADVAAILPKNPHVRFFSSRRGYVRARLTPDELRADFRVLPYVSRPGAPVETRATFVVTDRQRGVNLA